MSADRSPPYCPACGLTKPCTTCGKPRLGVVPDSIEAAGDAIAEAMAEIEKARDGLARVDAEKERYRLAYESAQSALEDAQAGRPLRDSLGRHDSYTLTVEKLRTLKVECRAIAVRLEAAGFASVADLASEVERLKIDLTATEARRAASERAASEFSGHADNWRNEATAEAHLGTVLADQLAAEKIAHLATFNELNKLRAFDPAKQGSEQTSWRYSEPSRNGEGWWIAFLDDAGALSVQSDWGDFSHRWPMGGMPKTESGRPKDLREFLVTCDKHYVLNKLAGHGEWVDVDASTAKIRKALLEYRKENRGVRARHYEDVYDWKTRKTQSKDAGVTVKEAVASAWESIDAISDQHGLLNFLHDSEHSFFVGEGPDAGDFYITGHTPQTLAFMEKIWPRVVAALRIDLGLPAEDAS